MLQPIGSAYLAKFFINAYARKRNRYSSFRERLGNCRTQASIDTVILKAHERALARYFLKHKLLVQRLDAKHIDDLGRNTFLGKHAARTKRVF